MKGATLFRIVALESAVHRLQDRINDRIFFGGSSDAEKAERKARNDRTRRAMDRLARIQSRLIREGCSREQFEEFVDAQIEGIRKTQADLDRRKARREEAGR